MKTGINWLSSTSPRRVVGNCPELGSWQPREGVKLRTSDDAFPKWHLGPVDGFQALFGALFHGPRRAQGAKGLSEAVRLAMACGAEVAAALCELLDDHFFEERLRLGSARLGSGRARSDLI